MESLNSISVLRGLIHKLRRVSASCSSSHSSASFCEVNPERPPRVPSGCLYRARQPSRDKDVAVGGQCDGSAGVVAGSAPFGRGSGEHEKVGVFGRVGGVCPGSSVPAGCYSAR